MKLKICVHHCMFYLNVNITQPIHFHSNLCQNAHNIIQFSILLDVIDYCIVLKMLNIKTLIIFIGFALLSFC